MMGTSTSASTHDSSSDTASTMNMSRTYSPVTSGLMKMGRNARMAIAVAPSSGMAVLRPMAVRASERGLPAFLSTRIPSTMTMALSTSIPMARMNEPSDTRCSVPSK